MRIFVQFDGNNRVVAVLQSNSVPGSGPGIPANMLEVTNRADGPWEGKIYDPGTDTFAFPAPTLDSRLRDRERLQSIANKKGILSVQERDELLCLIALQQIGGSER